MKDFLFLLLIITLYSCEIDRTPIDPPDEDKDLIAYWSFDEENSEDKSGNEYHGKAMGKYSYSGNAIKGKSLYIEGYGINTKLGGHIELPRIPLENYDEFTVELWVKEIGRSFEFGTSYISLGDYTYGCLQIINHFRHPCNTPENQHLEYQFSVGSKIGDYGSNTYKDDAIYHDFNSDNLGEWVYLVLTYKDGIAAAYVNGDLVGSKKQELLIHGNNSGIGIQYWYDGNEHETRLTAYIDEVKIWKKVLHNDDVKKEYDKIMNPVNW